MFRIFRSIIPLMLGLAVFSTIAVADDTGLYVAYGARIDDDGISPVSGTRVDDSDFGFAYQGILGLVICISITAIVVFYFRFRDLEDNLRELHFQVMKRDATIRELKLQLPSYNPIHGGTSPLDYTPLSWRCLTWISKICFG